MTDIFQRATRPNRDLFFQKNDANDIRLGEIVSREIDVYAASEIIILGCPQDEGVRRNGGRVGAALAPDAIRTQFYKLTNFGVDAKIFDIGDTIIQKTLEKTHETHTEIVEQILRDGKKIIILGGGNDISYADGRAMAKVFGFENWIAFNIDAHFDVRADFPPNSGTPYRQLLEEEFVKPENFFETAYQSQANSQFYFDYLKRKSVNLASLEKMRRNAGYNFVKMAADFQAMFINRKNIREMSFFFGFDVDSVRASDAPGVSAASPIGLTAEEFVELAKLAGENAQTRIIEFTETNPNFDIDNRTTKLVAIAMHRFCGACK